jgi:hypothetical protein
MAQPQWPIRQRRVGDALEPLNVKISLPFRLALRDYAEQQSQQHGRTISQGTILETHALRGNPALRKLHRQYEKELAPPAAPSNPT